MTINENIIIVSSIEQSPGWMPVNHMVKLAADIFECEIIHTNSNKLSKVDQLKLHFSRRKKNARKPDVLLVVATAAELSEITILPNWNKSFNRVVAWVIDSFWTQWYPKYPLSNLIDRLFITSGNDLKEYSDKSNVETSVLFWGTDALGLGGLTNKNIDLIRIGRQPESWNDDTENKIKCGTQGIIYHGRPPYTDNSNSLEILLKQYLQPAKFVLAHTNLVDDSEYTHPTKEYLTARWTDSLACGCTIIGVPPKSDYAFKNLLWPGATINLEDTVFQSNLNIIEDSVNNWTVTQAEKNYHMSLLKLDWRWRFKEIADYLEITSAKLDADLADILTIVEQ